MSERPTNSCGPFLKYPGGKRALLDSYKEFFPESSTGRYIEPMVGGGAIFFNWSSRWDSGSIISDKNSDLVNCYRELKRDSYIVAAQLSALIDHYNECSDKRGFFEGVRSSFNIGERSAANFIFMNRCGFNGLVRYNSKGEFNVSWGQRSKKVLEEVLIAGSILSQDSVTIRDSEDFSWVLMVAQPGDLVYFDPPYLSEKGFVSYSAGGFSLGDHIRLKEVALELVSRGVSVRISNAASVEARELYTGFSVVDMSARRPINCQGSGRGEAAEILVCG